jgi:ABC-type dipeptide/oligopeptide/nickel transport system ATPase subunit
VHVAGERLISTREGNGPVNALDNALRGAIAQAYPEIEGWKLVDYKVRILDAGLGTGAVTRVLVGTSDGHEDWTTVGVHENVIAASWHALEDAAAFGLLRRRTHGGLAGLLFHGAERRAELEAIDRKVLDTARTLGIEGLLERLPRALSGGQRQRVALGRALVRDPQVFLFDEPLSNLDARLRIEMRAEIRELHRRTKASMVYVTHDQEEAMTLADRMVVMKFGVVQQFGTPAECYGRPANRFVAGVVGPPLMNFVDGRVEGGTFISADLRLPLAAARWPHMPSGAATLASFGGGGGGRAAPESDDGRSPYED